MRKLALEAYANDQNSDHSTNLRSLPRVFVYCKYRICLHTRTDLHEQKGRVATKVPRTSCPNQSSIADAWLLNKVTCLVLGLNFPLGLLLTLANNKGSGEAARIRRLA